MKEEMGDGAHDVVGAHDVDVVDDAVEDDAAISYQSI